MWLNLGPSDMPNPGAAERGESRWLPSQAVARRRMQKLLPDTFIDTLDCPALNGLRSADDVLEGFLNGTNFRQVKDWELLQVNGELAGCLLLRLHTIGLMELVYMGLIPNWRGKGLGEQLVRALSCVLSFLSSGYLSSLLMKTTGRLCRFTCDLASNANNRFPSGSRLVSMASQNNKKFPRFCVRFPPARTSCKGRSF